MVRIVNKESPQIDENLERNNKLVKITREICGRKFHIFKSSIEINQLSLYRKSFFKDLFYKFKEKTGMYVYLGAYCDWSGRPITPRGSITVYNKDCLDDAIKLAEAYETSGEEEFTVKKDYDE